MFIRAAALSFIAACLLAGCSSKASPSSSSSTHTSAPSTVSVSGNVTVTGQFAITENGDATTCWTLGNSPLAQTLNSSSPYDAVKEGAQVVVTDAAGKTLGIGQLGTGRAAVAANPAEHFDCTFSFIVQGIPGGQSFYGVKVADQQPKQFAASSIGGVQIILGS